MPDLVVIVPSRQRPHTVAELAEAFAVTCDTDTRLIVAVDADDPTVGDYRRAADELTTRAGLVGVLIQPTSSMVEALNAAASVVVHSAVPAPRALAFMGDDHRPRTAGWDVAYLTALGALPGIVYGNDRLQGARLPTQFALSADVVRRLGHMAPPALTHLYVDNYWRDIGRAAGCITYLPDVVVEHVHPLAGTAEWDEGYQRVNDRAMYRRDEAAYRAYMAEHRDRDVLALRTVRAEGPR